MSTLRIAATAVTAATVTAMRYFGTTQQNQAKNPNYVAIAESGDTKESEQLQTERIIFIPPMFTEKAISDNYILEKFESDKQLFYYLRWRSNMELLHGNLKMYHGPILILILCTDLHCRKNSELLYVIGVENDKARFRTKNKRIEKWKMNEYFLTASQIKKKYGINPSDLPSGSRTKLNAKYNSIDVKKLIKRKNKISMDTYSELAVFKTNKVKSDKRKIKESVSKHRLISEIRKADTFLPIISFNRHKTKYYVDMVLLVQIKQNWICIIFSEEKNYYPVGIAIDCVDMTNKMNLFQAATNDKQYKWVENNIASLRIYNEKQDEITDDLKREIQRLRAENRQQKNYIYCLRKQNDELSGINNWYFQQTLDQNSNIKAHYVHSDSTQTIVINFDYSYNINIQ